MDIKGIRLKECVQCEGDLFYWREVGRDPYYNCLQCGRDYDISESGLPIFSEPIIRFQKRNLKLPYSKREKE